MTIEERKAQLMKKTYRMMFAILLIFGIPAIPAFFAGRWLDQTYNMRPVGSVIALIVAAIISWTIMIRVYLNIRAELKNIQKDEEMMKEEKGSSEEQL